MTKRILITTGIFPPDIGGPATYAKTIANALLKQGFEVEVVAYGQKNSKVPPAPRLRRAGKTENLRITIISRLWPKGLRHFIFFIAVLFKARKFDTIFSLNAVSVGLPSLFSAKIWKKKFIVKIVGDYAWEIASGSYKTILSIDDFQGAKKFGNISMLNKVQRYVARRADLLIVPSKYLFSLIKGWGISDQKIKTVYNGVDFVQSKMTKEDARNKISIHGNIILSVGRLVPWKGFRMLIKIMPKLLDINQFTRLIIIGSGPEKSNLEKMIKNMGLVNKVYLLGSKSRDELADYLAASDIFVLASGYEGFSHQILEAMAVGVPVVTTAIGGNREIIIQGENGFMVRYNDEFNLYEAIKTLSKDESLRDNFISEGKKTVNTFSVDRMIEETIELLKQ
jgi:glycosyltransferase involved in cell wall biosynthesis